MEERDKKRGKHGEREGKKEDGWMDRQADVTFLITLQMDWTCMYRYFWGSRVSRFHSII